MHACNYDIATPCCCIPTLPGTKSAICRSGKLRTKGFLADSKVLIRRIRNLKCTSGLLPLDVSIFSVDQKMRSSLLLILIGIASAAAENIHAASMDSQAQAGVAASPGDIKAAVADAHVAQDPLMISAMPPSDSSRSPRYRQEKAHLMKRMDRKSGKWGTSHPRYRLLEALWAYTRYRERHMAELDRWRTLYKSVSKQQKKVRMTTGPCRGFADRVLDAREGCWVRKEVERD